MTGSLFDSAERLLTDLLHGGSQTITTPLKVALVTVAGSDATPGTEVTGGSYARATVTMGAAATSSGTTTSANTAQVSIQVPAGTVVGWEIWDSSGTPKPLYYDYGITPRTYAAGDFAIFPIGNITYSQG